MNKDQRLRLHVASLIVEHNGEILMLKKKENRGGEYGLVGGRIEANQSAMQALIRESLEEAGIILQPQNLQLALVIHRQRLDYTTVHFFFKATEWEGQIENKEPHKCEHLKWVDITKLPDNTASVIKTGVKAYLKGKTYDEMGFRRNNPNKADKLKRFKPHDTNH